MNYACKTWGGADPKVLRLQKLDFIAEIRLGAADRRPKLPSLLRQTEGGAQIPPYYACKYASTRLRRAGGCYRPTQLRLQL